MAEGAVIGALRIVLGADTAKLEESLNKATGLLEGFAKTIKGIGVTLAAAAAPAALVKSIESTIESMDKLNKQSQKLGVPVEELSAMRYAAKLADVEVDTLSISMGKLAKNMSAVAGGKGGPAADAFKAIGVEAKRADGSLKTTSEMMTELAGKFAQFEDGAAKTALAIAIFGKAGANMIPFLNQGTKGLQEATEEAKQFGLVLDKTTTSAAERFQDNMKRLAAIQEGIVTRATAGLVVQLDDLSRALVAVAKDADTMQAIITGVSGFIKGITIAVIGLSNWLGQLARDARLVGEVFAGIKNLDWDAITTAYSKWQETSKQANKQADEQIKSLMGLHSTILPVIDDWVQLSNVQQMAVLKPAPIIATKNALDEFITSQKKALAQHQAEAEAVGQLVGTRERLRVTMQAEAIALANNITLTEAQNQKIRELGNEAQLAAQKLLGLQLQQEFLTPFEQYEQKIRDIDAAYKAAGGNAAAYEAARMKAAYKLAETYGEVAKSIVSPMAEAFKTLAQMNKKYAGIAKAAAIAEALVNTFLAATKALASAPPPFNYAAAAAVTAAGLVQVAKISATEFSTGGSFRVGGGMTGVDSQMVSFKASPGEMVDIRRPGQQSQPVTTVELAMPRTDNFFSTHVRQMVEALNKAAPDGYVLKVPA